MSPTQIKFLAFRVYRFRDNKAYDDLYVHFAHKVYRFVAFKLPRGEDAEELTAEVFLRAWEYMLTSDVQEVGGLFFKIARNLIANFYRKHHPTTELVEGSPAAIQSGSMSEDVADRLEVEALRASIDKLPADQSEILVLRFFNEMSVDEIAVILEKTPNNVRVLIHRARQALKKYVEPEG